MSPAPSAKFVERKETWRRVKWVFEKRRSFYLFFIFVFPSSFKLY